MNWFLRKKPYSLDDLSHSLGNSSVEAHSLDEK